MDLARHVLALCQQVSTHTYQCSELKRGHSSSSLLSASLFYAHVLLSTLCLGIFSCRQQERMRAMKIASLKSRRDSMGC